MREGTEVPPQGSFKIQITECIRKALRKDAGTDQWFQNLHIVLYLILFIFTPHSNQITTEVTFGPVVFVIPKEIIKLIEITELEQLNNL